MLATMPLASLLLAVVSTSQAAGLDAIEVGGANGTPAGTNPSAVWWNPAGIAAESGTQLLLEIAPTFGRASYTPGPDTPMALQVEGNSVTDQYTAFAPIPTLGFSSDFGVDGLGVGAAVFVPYAKGGTERVEPGPGRYALKHGVIMTAQASLAAAYEIADRVSIGASGSATYTIYDTRLDSDTMPVLHQQLAALGQESPYDDTMLGDPNYSLAVTLDQLSGVNFGWGLGTRVKITPELAAGVGFQWSPRVDPSGDAIMNFDCPPESDELGRFGTEHYGICDAEYLADSTMAYNLPWRLNLGVEYYPTEALRLELMGAYVAWSRYTDFDLSIRNVAGRNDMPHPDTAGLINRESPWARDGKDSFWVGADAKYDLNDRWSVGGRVIYDHSATPDSTVSMNNLDANTVILGGSGAFRATDTLEIGVGLSQSLAAPRDVESAYYMTTDLENLPAHRYDYIDTSGIYTISSTRIALSLSGHFGEKEEKIRVDY